MTQLLIEHNPHIIAIFSTTTILVNFNSISKINVLLFRSVFTTPDHRYASCGDVFEYPGPHR